MNITELRCEYGSNPLGIDNYQSEIKLDFRIRPTRSASNRLPITAASSLYNLQSGVYDFWDSGKVNSD